jgi:uncharacterized protein YbaR (Trm112 family)
MKVNTVLLRYNLYVISAELLEILICPACHAKLVLQGDNGSLACSGCRLVYPIEDGIPVLLVQRAHKPQ